MKEEAQESDSEQAGFRHRLWTIVFEAETPAGRAFDIGLLWAIVLSVWVVMLDSVESVRLNWQASLRMAEWSFTILFSIEYVVRIFLVKRPLRYIFSFFGLVDLFSCIPTYLAFFIPGSQHLLVIRVIRLLRMFRILKMVAHVRGANLLVRSLLASRAKVTVFYFTMLVFAVLMGTIFYLVESGLENTRFTNIPISIYYTIITITTIGYGDITPASPLGMALASFTGLMGFAIIAVPTGIVSSEMSNQANRPDPSTDACPGCGVHGHLIDARFCRKCGEKL